MQAKIGNPMDFDLQLAEHRARAIEKELCLNVKRKGKALFNSGGSFVTEMNLHNAGRPLKELIERVEKTLLAEDYQDTLGYNQGQASGHAMVTSKTMKLNQRKQSVDASPKRKEGKVTI